MKSLVAAAVLLAASSAHAGGYIGLGIGDGIATSGDIDYAADGRTMKLIGGFAFGKLAVEGSAQRADVAMVGNTRTQSLTQLGIAGKYSYPLSDGFEVYGKLGLNHATVSANDGGSGMGIDGSGNGYLFGGGAEYRSKLPVTFWVDYTVTNATITMPEYQDRSLTTRQWMIGASLGI
jgi:opacity protein-like surface antigen